ncbi:MAG: serpin family protein [Verrucomicrobiia bacterium]
MRQALETSVGRLFVRTISVSVVLALSTTVANGNPQAATPPETSPPVVTDVSAPDTREVVSGNTAFAINLYARLRMSDGNLFFSPYSISTALAMTYGGARGETEKQMAKVLGFTVPQARLHPAFAALKAELDAIQKKGLVQLSVANSLWPQKGYPFRPDFLGLLKQDYDTSVTPLDYREAGEAARKTINDWVEAKTNRKITDVIGPGTLGPLTRLVLANAIYFKGQWDSPFKSRLTTEQPFHLATGKNVKCQLMNKQEEFGYAETPDLQMLALPYAGYDLSMVVLLPRKMDGIGALENDLTAGKLAEWMEGLRQKEVQEVKVYLPKFKLTRKFSLAETLAKIGMTDAFSQEEANFSGMDGHTNLCISAVVHKAFVDVNEEGTEAAAATVVGMVTSGIHLRPPTIPVFRADHPFVFLIQDNHTGSILFLGRVMDPTA